MLAKSLADVRQRIHQACQRCGRDPHTVQLVCVTKTVPIETIREALALGVTDLGENRVQEARAKQTALGSGFWARGPQPSALSPERVRWHLVGHLQRNKAKDAVELFDVIHSVDSLALADVLEEQAAKRRTARLPLDVFVQVNVSGESTKLGCSPEEVVTLAPTVMRSPHLRLRGLMTIAPFSDDPENARSHFRRLRALRDSVASSFQLPASSVLLSMGMSGDFEVAIEEGADVVRIGTAIFGDRDEVIK